MLTAHIKRADCLRCGACWTICPEVFAEDPAEGTAMVVGGDGMLWSRVPAGLEDCAQRAAASCPVDIIRLRQVAGQ